VLASRRKQMAAPSVANSRCSPSPGRFESAAASLCDEPSLGSPPDRARGLQRPAACQHRAADAMLIVEQNAEIALGIAKPRLPARAEKWCPREPPNHCARATLSAARTWATRSPGAGLLERLFDGISNGAIYAALALALVMVFRGREPSTSPRVRWRCSPLTSPGGSPQEHTCGAVPAHRHNCWLHSRGVTERVLVRRSRNAACSPRSSCSSALLALNSLDGILWETRTTRCRACSELASTRSSAWTARGCTGPTSASGSSSPSWSVRCSSCSTASPRTAHASHRVEPRVGCAGGIPTGRILLLAGHLGGDRGRGRGALHAAQS